ncbi:methionyl-tRNA formyltransferase [Luteolibacter pohnpeiensis]|uniref:Methionyl-tRNA formyltransferase n=1 Tax=Luteolibacter pohnpeiensis TaxID=454153 RepID=A0A934S5Q4_9BACT|nr:methionyl-tRNA formyltransferase [Luteolibacter pohnpeiensis]MBK1881654.1 methionyl-tRNA formyltransferase [Luteolibacter pohnpeiensis]
MRLIFVATGDIALPSFRHLLEHGPKPLALVTQPDKPVGRHQVLTPPAIKTEALAAGIPVLQPGKIGDISEELEAMNPEVIAVMAYGQILRKNVLTLASKAIINLHASLLPKYRGAACIQAAIDAGDATTGVTAIHVVRELDAGDMICDRAIPIETGETGGSMHDKLADLAALVLQDALDKLQADEATGEPQDVEKSSYIPKLERDDGRLDWQRSAEAIERRIRAYDPWPGTFTLVAEDGKSKRLKIFPPTEVVDLNLQPGELAPQAGDLIVGCGTGALKLTLVQPEGGKRMSAADYVRGRKPTSMN